MKRIAYLALPLLLIGAIAAPAFAQDPKWKDTKEYDDYMLVFGEKDFAKKPRMRRSSSRTTKTRIPSL